jgi:lysophospholipase L1-like esterase
MIKPFQIFLYGLCVFLALVCLSLLFPSGKWALGSFVVKVPSFTFNSPQPTQKYKDISAIIKLGAIIDSTTVKSDSAAISVLPGSATKKAGKHIITLNTDSIKGILRHLEYPQGEDSILHPFFEVLQQLPVNKKLIHILHYGDSQIEGDRITSYVRNQLQSRFGGEGIGLFPVIAVNPAAVPYNYNLSGNWKRFSPMDRPIKADHNKYGILLSFSNFSKKKKLFAQDENAEGGILLKHSTTSVLLAQRFTQCQIFYAFNTSPMMVELKQKDSIIDADIIPPSPELNRLVWNFNKPEKDLSISFKTTTSPDFFAISLTGKSGIAVDNIPLRGSSGLEFTKTNRQFLGNFITLLNTKLIILQFGVNIVPIATNNYEFYEKSFRLQLEYLKQISGGVPIIVIGVSDVARNGDNGIESYPNIEKIRDAQKSAAFAAHCVFWDMYEAMGGKNSIPSWVNAKPPLAQKDYTHLNPLGARIIGEMFYRTLIGEYNKYVAAHKTEAL